MFYEHDREAPFLKILVKNDSSVVGVIRRSLDTGYYHYYEDMHNSLNCLLKEKRIDLIEMRIEELYALREVIPNLHDSGLVHRKLLNKTADTQVQQSIAVAENEMPMRGFSGTSLGTVVAGALQKIWGSVVSATRTLTEPASVAKWLSMTFR